MLLDGKVAIVTGAGSGIGRAICAAFAREGAAIAALDINRQGAEETISMLPAAGVEHVAVAADVASRVEVDRAVTDIATRFGRIDILCNNAGIFDKGRPALDTDDELWDRVLATNLFGVLVCSQRVIPEMQKVGKGAIVNTASTAGVGAGAGGVAYTASKHGVVGVTRALAEEFSAQGIRVNCFCPGGVNTAMTANATPEGRRLALDKQMIKRWSEPEEMANVALFLASDLSSFCTGAVIAADAGWSAR